MLGPGSMPFPAEMSTGDENEVSRTVPRRGLPREVPHVGVVIVVGAGDSPETLRKPRIVPMDQLTLDIGRRAPVTPVPGAGGAGVQSQAPSTAATTTAAPDATASRRREWAGGTVRTVCDMRWGLRCGAPLASGLTPGRSRVAWWAEARPKV